MSSLLSRDMNMPAEAPFKSVVAEISTPKHQYINVPFHIKRAVGDDLLVVWNRQGIFGKLKV